MCDMCPQEFAKKAQLMHHIAVIHQNQPPKARPKAKNVIFNCDQCDKTFVKKTSLEAHVLKIHQQKLTLKCDECCKMFATSCKLSSHKGLVHAKVQCELCNEEVYNKYALRGHLSKMHGVSPSK